MLQYNQLKLTKISINTYSVDESAATIWSKRRNAFLQFFVEVFVINISVSHQAVPLQQQQQQQQHQNQ